MQIKIQGVVVKGDVPNGFVAPIPFGTVQIFRIDLRRITTTLLKQLNITPPTVSPASLKGAALRELRSEVISNWRKGCGAISVNDFDGLLVKPATETPIDQNGAFSVVISLEDDELQDFAFEVQQPPLGGGQPLEILEARACSAHFNYNGDLETLTVTNPNAVASLPAPLDIPPNTGPYVCATAIGNTDLRDINNLHDPTSKAPSAGLIGESPWGGNLALQVVFDPFIRSNHIQYYRWSYSFGGAPFAQMDAIVTHRYMTFSDGEITLHPVVLGPKTIGGEPNLFEVPEPSPDPIKGGVWVDINDPSDRPCAYFGSADKSLPRSGKVTLRMEMFNDQGKHVPCSNTSLPGGKFKFVLPDKPSPEVKYTKDIGPNIDPAGNLIFTVQVDNEPTVANLLGVTAGGKDANPCGMLNYSKPTDEVDIKYVATQPHDHFSWSLAVSKGIHGEKRTPVGGSKSSPPWVLPDTPNSPVHNQKGSYNNTAADLLGQCLEGGAAAFTVSLSCTATATDGYQHQSQYDSSDLISFALLKATIPLK